MRLKIIQQITRFHHGALDDTENVVWWKQDSLPQLTRSIKKGSSLPTVKKIKKTSSLDIPEENLFQEVFQ